MNRNIIYAVSIQMLLLFKYLFHRPETNIHGKNTIKIKINVKNKKRTKTQLYKNSIGNTYMIKYYDLT